jgi:hypothetical protein
MCLRERDRALPYVEHGGVLRPGDEAPHLYVSDTVIHT